MDKRKREKNSLPLNVCLQQNGHCDQAADNAVSVHA